MRDAGAVTRRRMSKAERRAQLLEVARELIREAGTDELSLGRVAARAGVTKPLVYDHFGDRAGVLAELHREFEARQRAVLVAALDDAAPELAVVAHLMAGAYIDCCLAEGRELADVLAALEGSAELRSVRQEAEDAYVAMCRAALEPVAGPIDTAAMDVIVGAGDALVRSMHADRISAARARSALAHVIIAMAAADDATPPAS